MTADLAALAAMGVDSVDFSFPGETVEQVLEAMRAFHASTLSKV